MPLPSPLIIGVVDNTEPNKRTEKVFFNIIRQDLKNPNVQIIVS